MLARIAKLLRMEPPLPGAGLLFASGLTKPVDGTYGYRTGCIFQHTDGTTNTSAYLNEGTLASCSFQPIISSASELLSDASDVGVTDYTAGSILVADGDSWEEVAVSGQATLAATGALTVPLLSATLGVVTASKAVLVDASKDVSAFHTVGCVNLDCGSAVGAGVGGRLRIYSATTAKGRMQLDYVDGGADNSLLITNDTISGSDKTATFTNTSGKIVVSTAALTCAQVDVLASVAPGTAAASKALVLGLSKEIATITTLTATTINNTTLNSVSIGAGSAAGGTAGSVNIFPVAAAAGKLAVTSAGSTGDFSITLTTALNDTSAKTVTIPALTGYVALSTATLALAEVDVLQDVTPGTAAASKAVVLSSARCLTIGVEEFTTAGTTGIVVDGVTKHSGIEFYYTDGGVKLAAGYTEAFRNGYLVSIAITGDTDVSTYTAHDYIYLAESVSTRGGVGATWASLLVKAGKTITTTAGVCDFSAFNASVDVPDTAVIGTGTWACGYAAGGNLGGTHTGKAAGFRLRVPSAGKWDVGIRMEPTACVKGISIGDSSSSAGSGIPLSSTNYCGNGFYFDDGGVALTAGSTEGIMARYLVTQNIAGAPDVSLSSVHIKVYANATIDTSGGMSAVWGDFSVAAGKTITATGASCGFSGGHFSIDVPNTSTIAANTVASGVSVGGNLGGTHNGIAVALHVKTPTAGAWDGVFAIPAAMAIGTADAAADVAGSIPIYVGGVVKYLQYWPNPAA